MPQSLHKILIHGAEVIESLSLPIGLLSEEAQEARSKNLKKYREHHSRKSSRMKTNVDVMKRLLCTSDPVISSYRKTISSINKKFPHGVVELFICENSMF